jgi:hypothetical protein
MAKATRKESPVVSGEPGFVNVKMLFCTETRTSAIAIISVVVIVNYAFLENAVYITSL